MIQLARVEPSVPRAFLRVAGMPLALHQLGVALALRCERIICIASGISPELVELQHCAERQGARFHVISGSQGLIGLIAANDELFVLADGLLAEPSELVSHLEAGPGVIVQPIDVGEPAGFERIDLNNAAAGAFRLPGKLVEQISELPLDCDTASSLQRIALQAGLPQRMLASGLPADRTWRLVRDDSEAQLLEAEWFRRHTTPSLVRSGSDLVAGAAVRSIGPALMHSGSGGNTVGILAFAVLLLAVGAAWFRLPATAFVLCGLAEIFRRAAVLLVRIERYSLNLQHSSFSRERLFGWALDFALIAVGSLSGPVALGGGILGHAFPAVMLVIVLRLIPRVIDAAWIPWLEDRGLLAAVLGLVVVVTGGMPAGLWATSAVLLGVLAVVWPDRARLTRA